MASALTLSSKQLNFAHVAIACLDIIKLPLVDILAAYIKPSQLSSSLESGVFRFTQDELGQCSVPLPDYNNFNFMLLYKLIRHLCTSLKPKQGWGKKPNDDDITLADDIERMRLFRNEHIAHCDHAEISDMQFELIWKDITLVMRRMDSAMQEFKCNTNYEQKIKDVLGRAGQIDEIAPITKVMKGEIENMKRDINIAIGAPWFKRIPTESELANVSEYIGADFPILGLVLGLRSSEIDQIRLDNPLSSRTQISMMLCLWRKKNLCDATIEKLISALRKTCPNTDIKAVENEFLKQ